MWLWILGGGLVAYALMKGSSSSSSATTVPAASVNDPNATQLGAGTAPTAAELAGGGAWSGTIPAPVPGAYGSSASLPASAPGAPSAATASGPLYATDYHDVHTGAPIVLDGNGNPYLYGI